MFKFCVVEVKNAAINSKATKVKPQLKTSYKKVQKIEQCKIPIPAKLTAAKHTSNSGLKKEYKDVPKPEKFLTGILGKAGTTIVRDTVS